MRVEQLAYYIWDFLRRHDGERSAAENWFLAEHVLAGNRPAWLFEQDDFRPFTTLSRRQRGQLDETGRQGQSRMAEAAAKAEHRGLWGP